MENIIVITGDSGSGKTYLAELLAEGLAVRGEECHIMDNVSSNGVGVGGHIASNVVKLEGNILITLREFNQDTFPVKANFVIEAHRQEEER